MEEEKKGKYGGNKKETKGKEKGTGKRVGIGRRDK